MIQPDLFDWSPRRRREGLLEASESDIGRRVVYDPGVKGMPIARGVLAGIGDLCLEIAFDGQKSPLNVISNLRWEARR